MKASELREIAKQAMKIEINDIEKKIMDEAKLGKTSIHIETMSQGAQAYFKDQGYEVEGLVLQDRYLPYKIKW